MQVPDSPEQLFEQLSEKTLRAVFPGYDKLGPLSQKMIRLIHTEMTKGELTDAAMCELALTFVATWKGLNLTGLSANWEALTTHDDIEESWIVDAVRFHRVDQTLESIFALLMQYNETFCTPESDETTRYLVRSTDAP